MKRLLLICVMLGCAEATDAGYTNVADRPGPADDDDCDRLARPPGQPPCPKKIAQGDEPPSLSCTIGQPGFRWCPGNLINRDAVCMGSCSPVSHCGACEWHPNIGRTGGRWVDENGGTTGCPQFGGPDLDEPWTTYFCQVTGF